MLALLVATSALATYSVVATDSATGQVGGAGTSCVGSLAVSIIYASAPGHGAVHARALFEMQLDALAAEIGMDSIELRLKNVMETGDVTCNELNMSSLGMRECLEAVRDRSGWTGKRGA